MNETTGYPNSSSMSLAWVPTVGKVQYSEERDNQDRAGGTFTEENKS